jgi:antitoxin ParD1/3/4
MATNVHLTRELEQFARSCVEQGRYNNVSEVVRSGLRLLQEAEARRQAFMTMLQSVEEETDRDGPVAVDDVLREIDQIIDAKVG